MCHKERKMGTMVQRILLVNPANFLHNMVKIFANTSNTLMVPNMKAPVSAGGHLEPERGPYPQLERGQSISRTRKGPVHVPN